MSMMATCALLSSLGPLLRKLAALPYKQPGSFQGTLVVTMSQLHGLIAAAISASARYENLRYNRHSSVYLVKPPWT